MLEELNISITIDTKNKILYIAEENSSGAEYEYNNIQYLTNKVKFYLENYYSKEFENNDKNM